MVWNKLITALRRENPACNDDGASAKKTKTPADGAENPGLVELPANKEPVFIVEQVCLDKLLAAYAIERYVAINLPLWTYSPPATRQTG